jgi:hypothetical protein
MLLCFARTSCACLMRPFGADGDGHLVDGGGVEGGAEADGLREIRWWRAASYGDAVVERFASTSRSCSGARSRGGEWRAPG